ncbi:unnamed protein product [Sympodiomycopsis kandeliae]
MSAWHDKVVDKDGIESPLLKTGKVCKLLCQPVAKQGPEPPPSGALKRRRQDDEDEDESETDPRPDPRRNQPHPSNNSATTTEVLESIEDQVVRGTRINPSQRKHALTSLRKHSTSDHASFNTVVAELQLKRQELEREEQEVKDAFHLLVNNMVLEDLGPDDAAWHQRIAEWEAGGEEAHDRETHIGEEMKDGCAISEDHNRCATPLNSIKEAGWFSSTTAGVTRNVALDNCVVTLGLPMHPLSLTPLLTEGIRLPVREYDRTGKYMPFTPCSGVGQFHLGLGTFYLEWEDSEVVLLVRPPTKVEAARTVLARSHIIIETAQEFAVLEIVSVKDQTKRKVLHWHDKPMTLAWEKLHESIRQEMDDAFGTMCSVAGVAVASIAASSSSSSSPRPSTSTPSSSGSSSSATTSTSSAVSSSSSSSSSSIPSPSSKRPSPVAKRLLGAGSLSSLHFSVGSLSLQIFLAGRTWILTVPNTIRARASTNARGFVRIRGNDVEVAISSSGEDIKDWAQLPGSPRLQSFVTEANRLVGGEVQNNKTFSISNTEHKDRLLLLSILNGTCQSSTTLTVYSGKVSPPGILGVPSPWFFKLTLGSTPNEDVFGFKSEADWKEVSVSWGFNVNAGRSGLARFREPCWTLVATSFQPAVHCAVEADGIRVCMLSCMSETEAETGFDDAEDVIVLEKALLCCWPRLDWDALGYELVRLPLDAGELSRERRAGSSEC